MMSRHSDFFLHYEDNSCPLNDIFAEPDSQDWVAKASDIQGTKSKLEGNTTDTSAMDSLIDMNLLEDAAKNSFPSSRTLMGNSSIFNTFPRDTSEFRVMTSTNQDSSLCANSGQPNGDEVSEQTGFSEFFSEPKIQNNPLHPSATHAGGTNKLASPGAEMHSTLGDDSEALSKLFFNEGGMRREVQKPPTTAGIKLEHLKAVFHLERPKAEKKLGLKRTTFSNLSRHYGISKWPFRTIRDALNRMEANKRLLDNGSLSKERRRKLQRQQQHLHEVIDLIYKDPRHSRDSNTLAVLLVMVAAKDNR